MRVHGTFAQLLDGTNVHDLPDESTGPARAPMLSPIDRGSILVIGLLTRADTTAGLDDRLVSFWLSAGPVLAAAHADVCLFCCLT